MFKIRKFKTNRYCYLTQYGLWQLHKGVIHNLDEISCLRPKAGIRVYTRPSQLRIGTKIDRIEFTEVNRKLQTWVPICSI